MRETLAGVPDGLAPLVLARLSEEEGAGSPPLLLHVARDDRRLEALAEGLAFFAPKVRVIQMPAWDTVPYDRIGPNARDRGDARGIHGPAGRGRAQGADRRPHHRQFHPAAPAPARVHPPLAQDHRARPAHRHEPAGPAPRPRGLPAHRHRHGSRRIRHTRRHPRPVPAGASVARAPRLLRRHARAHQGVRSRDAAHRQDRAAAHPDADQRGGFRRRGREALPEQVSGDVRPRDPGGRALRGRQRRPALSRHGALAAAVPRPAGDAVRLRARRARQLRPPGRAGGRGAPRPDRGPLRCARAGAGGARLRCAALQARAGGRDVPDQQGVGRATGRPHRAPHDAVRGGVVVSLQRRRSARRQE